VEVEERKERLTEEWRYGVSRLPSHLFSFNFQPPLHPTAYPTPLDSMSGIQHKLKRTPASDLIASKIRLLLLSFGANLAHLTDSR
jgi:hypothetical protein